jgi:hypothetical protein
MNKMIKVLKMIIRCMQQLGSFGRPFRIRSGFSTPPVPQAAVPKHCAREHGKNSPTKPRRSGDVRAADAVFLSLPKAQRSAALHDEASRVAR